MKDAKPKRLIAALVKQGFVEKSNNKHLKLVKGERTLHIQTHGVIKRNTVASIQKASGIDKETFYNLF